MSGEAFSDIGLYGFKVDEFMVGEKTIDHILIRDFSYDDTFVKDGYTILQVLLDQDSLDYDFWEKLRKDMKEYNAYKNKIALHVKDMIEEHVPELKDHLEILDVATPVTLNRYTNASRGTYMSFLFNDTKGVMLSKCKVVGLHNFLLSGQYMQTPGGLPLALASGRFSIQWIIKREKSKFRKLSKYNRN